MQKNVIFLLFQYGLAASFEVFCVRGCIANHIESDPRGLKEKELFNDTLCIYYSPCISKLILYVVGLQYDKI